MKVNTLFFIAVLLLLQGCGYKHHRMPDDPNTVYQRDKYGNILYHKPSLKLRGDRVYQADKYGNILYHRPHYSIKRR
jgi:hypothetical protein